MTAQEMKDMAEIVYESIATNDAAGYDEFEWSVLLSDAQEQVIQSMVKEGVEYDDFSKLTFAKHVKGASSSSITASSVLTHSYTVDFAGGITLDSFWLILKDIANSDPTIKVLPISFDYYNANINNPFKKPKATRFWRLFYNDDVYVTTPTSTTLSAYTIVYLEKPSAIIVPGVAIAATIDGTTVTAGINSTGQNCTYHEIIHKKIVRAAAKLAKLYASDLQGWQSHLAESKN